MIKLSVFKKKKSTHSCMTILTFQASMAVKVTKFSWSCTTSQTTQLYLEQTTLTRLHLALSGSQYAMIFSQSFINADFVTSEIAPDILMNVPRFHYIPYLGSPSFV